MSIKSRARFVQRHLNVPYQRARQIVEGRWQDSRKLCVETGWPMKYCDHYLEDSTVGREVLRENGYTTDRR